MGYYDVKTTLQEQRVRTVRMEKDLPRGSGIFGGGGTPGHSAQVGPEGPQLENFWTGKHIPQAHMDYKTQLSRAQCTKKVGEREGVWLFSKTQKDIQRKVNEQKKRELAVERVMQKNNNETDLHDDKTEHKAKKFTCDMSKIGSVKAHYLNGLEMLRETIHRNLDKDDKRDN